MTVPCGTRAGSPTGSPSAARPRYAGYVARIETAPTNGRSVTRTSAVSRRRAAVGRHDASDRRAAVRPRSSRRRCADRRRAICVAPRLRRWTRCDERDRCRAAAAAISKRSVSPRSTAGGRLSNAMRGKQRAPPRARPAAESRSSPSLNAGAANADAQRARRARRRRPSAPRAHGALLDRGERDRRPEPAARRPRSPRDARARRESATSSAPRNATGAQRLLALDRRRDAAARRSPSSRRTRPHDRRRRSPRARAPTRGTARAAAAPSTARSPSADAPSARSRHVAPTASATPATTCSRRRRVALALDQLEDGHGVGRLVTA